jgi:predicted GNAT family N-acyltransferase
MSDASLTVKVVEYAREGAAIRAIRDAVFVAEQGVPAELEHDELDVGAVHVLVYDGARPVATGRILADGRIGRMAVLARERGRGAGRLMLAELVAAARRAGLDRVYCHAQCHALGFYEAMGFTAEGPVFTEAGIEHRYMSAPLA